MALRGPGVRWNSSGCWRNAMSWPTGCFSGQAPAPMGFVISRAVIDEAEILTVALAAEARGRGYARPLLQAHLEGLVAGRDRPRASRGRGRQCSGAGALPPSRISVKSAGAKAIIGRADGVPRRGADHAARSLSRRCSPRRSASRISNRKERAQGADRTWRYETPKRPDPSGPTPSSGPAGSMACG